MTSKERVLTTFEFREPDRVPCWLGASPEFIDNAIKELGVNNEEELLQVFGDDFRRVIAPYRHKNQEDKNQTPFGIPRAGIGYGMATDHPLKDSGLNKIADYRWPDPENVDITKIRNEAKKYFRDYAIL